jgi:hypothetical protein
VVRWEYAFFFFRSGRGHKRIVTFSSGAKPWEPIREDEMVPVFHRLGEEGWELTQYSLDADAAIYFFKRPRQA